MQYRLRQTLRATFGTVFLLASAVVVAETGDTTRQEAIRANSVGTGVADKAIEQDRANRVDNSQHNEVGNATSFLNNLQQQRAARENVREAQRERQYANLEAAYDAATRNGMQYASDLEARKPINWSRPNAGDDAWVILQYCIKRWEDRGDMYRDHTIECEVARAKLVLGLNGGGGYAPDPKAAIKEFKALLKTDMKEQGKAEPRWPAVGAEILHYMGDAYLIGMDFRESTVKQDYAQAREYYEQSIRYGDLAKANIYSVIYQVNSYFRLIEMYNMGLGVEKDPAKAQALAKEVAGRVAAVPDHDYWLNAAPEWEQVKDIVSPYIKP